MGDTLNRDLVRPFMDLNFGPQAAYPRVTLPVQEPEDLSALADVLNKMVPLGMDVEKRWARDKFGVPDPEDGAELLSLAPAAPVPAANRERPRARNREAPDADDIDELAAEAADDWQPQMAPLIDPIQRLADEVAEAGGGRDAFLARLPELLEQMDADELVQRLATVTFQARGLGDATDEVD